MMPETFTLDEVSALLTTVLHNIRVRGSIKNGAYPLLTGSWAIPVRGA